MIERYKRATLEDYIAWRKEHLAEITRVAADPNRLAFHVQPEIGWLNDPNGLVQIDGVYHIYHQYSPFCAAEPGVILWNHVTTTDFVTYTDKGPVLFPDCPYDVGGAYSGSALRRENATHFFYTGNVKLFDRDDYDYVNNGRAQNQIHIATDDPGVLGEKHAVLTPEDYPSDIGCHVRDPKIIEVDGLYYMVLGARTRSNTGCVLVYVSGDLDTWNYCGRIELPERFGYMWECPDLFYLDGELVLICCPQGVEPSGWRYQNAHQCVAMRVEADFKAGEFKVVDGGQPAMVDAGFDFYAPQSFVDEQGRRLMFGWVGCPDSPLENPTVEQGWQHALSVPRELHMRDGKLIQEPVKELDAMRGALQTARQNEPVACPGRLFDAVLECKGVSSLHLCLRQGVALEYKDGMLVLNMVDEGHGRTLRMAPVDRLNQIRVLSDTSMLEVFVNGGELAMTTRTYSPALEQMVCESDGEVAFDLYSLLKGQ